MSGLFPSREGRKAFAQLSGNLSGQEAIDLLMRTLPHRNGTEKQVVTFLGEE
jgi:hypothetical protein